MPLPTFETEADIPTAVRSGYIEREGKWIPDDLDNTKQILNEKKKLQQRLTDLESKYGGVDPDEIKQLLADKRTADEKRQKDAGEFDKLLDKRLNETKIEYEKRLAELSPYKTKYEDRVLEIAIRDAAVKAGVIPSDLQHVLKIVKGSSIRYDEKSDKVVVVDEDGDVTSATPEKFFAETFKTQAPKFYQPSGGSGGGATPGSGSVRTNGTIDRTDNAAFLANLDKIAKGEIKVT